MKTWTFTVLIAGLFVLPFVLFRDKGKSKPIQSDENKRYDINDYLDDQSF